MSVLVVGALLACPLMSGGVLTYPTHAGSAWAYRVYVANPSPFPFDVDRIELVLRDGTNEDSFHGYYVPVPRTTIHAHTQTSIDLGPQPDVNPPLLAGSHIECAR